MIGSLLAERKLPELMKMNDGTPVTAENWQRRRRELLDLLAEYEYGKMPEYGGGTTWSVIRIGKCAAGNAYKDRVEITFPTPDGEAFTFPVTVVTPTAASGENKMPAFVHISFGSPDYYPAEELADSGVIVADMIMNDVAFDGEDNYSGKMASHYIKDGKRSQDDMGKITMWSFAASRVLDYLLSLDCVDSERVGVVGHSRLGKTAMWAGANDERFKYVFSNDSGCSGAAVTRGKVGETFARIRRSFPYWFCENMKKYSETVEDIENAPFDQHFLIAAVAPRHFYAASATEDEWADPTSEYLGCVAASPAWEISGLRGFVYADRLPQASESFSDGEIGYHLRPGIHFLSRHDWQKYVEFIKK